MIRKVKEMHKFTDARAAIVGIINGKKFWYDEAGVLSQLGIAHEPQERLHAQNVTNPDASAFCTEEESPSRQSRNPISLTSQTTPYTSLQKVGFCPLVHAHCLALTGALCWTWTLRSWLG
jgi:hypothetical protein